MIPSKSDNTCLVCSHAIGNHTGNRVGNVLEQYYCEFCICKFEFIPHSDYITVANDPYGHMDAGTRIMIKPGIIIPVTDFLCSICFHPQEQHYNRADRCLVPTCTFKCIRYVYMAPEDYEDWGIKSDSNLSPDAPTIINDKGGKQSELTLRFDLLDTKAMFQLASILHQGAQKYGDNNWRNIPAQDHINHALVHIFAYLQHDTQDDHLGHAFCRLMFALGTEHDSTLPRE